MMIKEIKVMDEVKGQGHTHISPNHSWDMDNNVFDLEK